MSSFANQPVIACGLVGLPTCAGAGAGQRARATVNAMMILWGWNGRAIGYLVRLRRARLRSVSAAEIEAEE